MSVFLKRNYYEALGVNMNASPGEISRAYELTKNLLSDESGAVYSLYSQEEKRERLETLEEAYRTLSSRDLKKEYDEALAKMAPRDGTYEVDLAYIFAGHEKDAQAPPEPLTPEKGYTQASLTRQIAALDRNESVANEQFKLLGSKLDMLSKKAGQKVVAFTSAVKGEGKSAVSLNTAFVLSSAFGKKVILVECDIRKPSCLQEHIQVDGPGLMEVLKDEARLDDAIRAVDDTGLHILYAGKYDAHSSDLIGSPNTAAVINSLRRRFDLVVLDCPPVIPLADMSIIEKIVDGLVLVVRAGETSKNLVKQATESLDRKKFIGAVLNGADTRLDKYYY